MITVTHRRRPSPALLAMLVVLALPALAQAQLFPNLQVKRQRPSCAAEDPVYRVYRQQFYGYYPTQWRTFPPGWHLLSPEAVSRAQLEEARRDIQKEAALARPEAGDEEGTTEPEDGAEEMPEVPETKPDATIPLPPRGLSPFDTDPQPPGDPAPLPNEPAVPSVPRASAEPPAAEPPVAAADPLDSAPPLDDAGPSDSAEADSPPPLPALDGSVSPGASYAPRDDDMPAPPVAPAVASAKPPRRRTTLLGGLVDTFRGRRRK